MARKHNVHIYRKITGHVSTGQESEVWEIRCTTCGKVITFLTEETARMAAERHDPSWKRNEPD